MEKREKPGSSGPFCLGGGAAAGRERPASEGRGAQEKGAIRGHGPGTLLKGCQLRAKQMATRLSSRQLLVTMARVVSEE